MVRGRLRLGLAVGVRSLCRPAFSSCSRARERVEESTGSEFRSYVLESNADWLRLWVAVGGVFDSGGEINVGVAMPSPACEAITAPSPISSRAMLMTARCCDRRRRAIAAGVEAGRLVAKSVEVGERFWRGVDVYVGWLGNGRVRG